MSSLTAVGEDGVGLRKASGEKMTGVSKNRQMRNSGKKKGKKMGARRRNRKKKKKHTVETRITKNRKIGRRGDIRN